MNTDVATKPAEGQKTPEVLKKREAYANLGELLHHGEMGLQLKAQTAIKKIKLPASIEDIPAAEALLAETKKAKATIEAERKEMTGKLKPVVDRMMQPEKSLEAPIDQLTNAIIVLKKKHEEEERAKLRKQEEAKNIIQQIVNYRAEADHNCRSQIAVMVTSAYEHALGKGDIKPEEKDAYLAKVEKKMGVVDFELPKPSFKTTLVTAEELAEIIEKNFIWNPHAYLTIFKEELKNRFIDYSVAYQNKESALLRAKQEEATAQEELLVQKSNAEMAAALDAISTPLEPDTVGPQIKSLKKNFEINMVESADNCLIIWSAFAANKQAVLSKMRVQKWFSMTTAQIMLAFGKIKSEDNNFEATGLKWKEVDKL